MSYLIVAAVCLLAGFGVGRVKNAQKLAAVRAELNQIALGVQAEGKAVVASIRALI
ncbi:Uncharacterised protein [uncultured archaeon]|nr:Uncharacterised protein [uncultured archaeon]